MWLGSTRPNASGWLRVTIPQAQAPRGTSLSSRAGCQGTPALPLPHTPARGNASWQPQPDRHMGPGTEDWHGPSSSTPRPEPTSTLASPHPSKACSALPPCLPPTGIARETVLLQGAGRMKGWGWACSDTYCLRDLGQRLTTF